ncbi:GIY-YIG nuclease family protein [Desulfosporosinus hippei]|uniref:GIY-YIG catalytic domain-containing protein n=1 Tax=Desulfosporosinus hippei DSM 8344 TaxID=1121419 RepID=A0A1G8HUR6_9FIRM|nr:GIY-YIG nuclease family protein [Desulfosporosinus hippei]SDI10220.1 hypothetical protein SAMN05443529_12665 [Desulfosporosinus hippei DSM 8344]
MDRKKELKEQYLQMKPEMGILIIRSKHNNKCFIQVSQRLQATLNRLKFQLDLGSHRNSELQKEWKEYGEGSFTIEVLEKLEYDKDETKTDYTDDLALLQMEWEEKMGREKVEFY